MSEPKEGPRIAGMSDESLTAESGAGDASTIGLGIANTSNNGTSVTRPIARNTPSSSSNFNISKSPSPPLRPSTAIDPLSHHILKRTNTENTIPQRLKVRNAGLSESTSNTEGGAGAPASPEVGPPSRQFTAELSRSDSNLVKEKKKGVSFLSRFSIIGSKKKDQSMDHHDDESEFGDYRMEGMNAHVYSSSVGANGYIPQFPKPRYIKVRAHNKTTREFDRIFLSQILNFPPVPVNEKVFLSSKSDVRPPSPNKLSKPQLKSSPIWTTEFSRDGKYLAVAGKDQFIRIYPVISTHKEREDHEKDEDASSNNASSERLSAPVFKSKPVREFHGHTGDVLDLSWSKNNFLLSSSMDKSVRLWHISREECLCTFRHRDFVTSIAFHPTDDRFFLAGSLDQVLRFWSIPDKSVAFWTQLPDLITAVAFSPDGKTAIAGLLGGLCLFYETEGLKYHTQIHVRSSRGKNAKGSKITGIRTGVLPHGDAEVKVLVTSNDSRIRLYNLKDKSLEMKFRGHENTYSQIKASFSEDGKYVICGSEDRKAYIWSTSPSIDSENKDKRPFETFEAHSEMVTCAIMASTKTRQLLDGSGDPIYDLCNPPPVTLLSREESNASLPNPDSEKRHSDPPSEHQVKPPEESPAYLARSTHKAGNIIVTADYSGAIKIFRQDCAHTRRNEHWETSSNFSKKMLGRTNSIRTRNSNSSRRSSLSSPHIGGNDILSWRSGVERGARSARSERSVSPGKMSRTSMTSITNSNNNLAQASRHQPYATTPLTATSSTTTSPPQSLHQSQGTKVGQPPTPSFTFTSDNPLKLDGGRSYQFWNTSFTPPKSRSESLRPPMQDRNASIVSKLSSEEPSAEEESDEDAITCKKCGGKDFRARKLYGKSQRLVCTKCYTVADQ